MITWNEFVNYQHKLDFKQIESIYDKSHIAVEIVNWYNPSMLNNIATIADLSSGAYGIYNSGENKKVIPQDKEQKLIYFGKINKQELDNLPALTIRKYYPQINPNEIQSSDTIHVNVHRIMHEMPTDLGRVFEIASTIIHEAIHEMERETTGTTSEVGPINAERKFKAWFQTNLQLILSKYKELSPINNLATPAI